MDFSILIHPSKWCAPAVIYALLTVASVALVLTVAGALGPLPAGISKWGLAAMWLISVIIMMYIMLYLCQVGYEWAAWVLLLLPVGVTLWQKLRQ